MKKLLGCLFIICLALNSNAQLLWKITGNGLDKPSYIFGTHHIAPISILDSIAGFQQAFDETTQVIGEVVMKDLMSNESMAVMQKYIIIAGDTTLKTLLTPEEFEMVNSFTKENLMVDIEVASKLKPAFISNNIAVVLAMKSMPDYNPEMQLDMYLQQKGTEQNKKIDGFETMEFQLNMLFEAQSLERQTELLLCSLNDLDEMIITTQKLTDAYIKQDLKGLQELLEMNKGDNCDLLPGEMAILIDNRNINWAKAFPEKVKEGPAFIVVGAGHLPGDKGMINLLREKGYTVQPVS